MKQAFWFLCAIIVSTFASGALVSAEAQLASPTPDSFAIQLTNTPSATFATLGGDMSADGRFVVFVSNGNHATQNPQNADGNREIFLIDYAQRRIFQITNTKNVPIPAASPSPTPTPSPSPSPTASPTPTPSPVPVPEDLSQVKIWIVNKEPMLTLAPTLVGGVRSYTIVFSSNAPDPGNFNGMDSTALSGDANSEIWIYRVPAVTDVNLTLGTDLPFQDLSAGAFAPITPNTPAASPPRAASASAFPFFSDDNRDPTISEDGRIIAFVSTRNIVTAAPGNADFNPEIFFYDLPNTTFIQGTNTQTPADQEENAIFQANPNLSADGSRVAFFSNANIATNSPNNADNNGEVYSATFTGSAMTNVKQLTRTQDPTFNVNVFSPGRRLSRNGALIAFESRANDPKANSTTNANGHGLFVCNIDADTFVEIGPRPTDFPDLARVPTFTDYNAGLAPSSLVYFSILNFRADGTVPAEAQAAEGLNPFFAPQIFLTQIPASTSNTFVRITNTPPGLSAPRLMASASRTRLAYNLGGIELGGGNTDLSTEIFYQLSPIVTAVDPAVLTFNTGASNMPVATATPVPSPSPSPTPTPSPSPGVALGLAPGQFSFIRSTVPLATTSTASAGGIEASLCLQDAAKQCRSPALPVELNGVSVSVNGAAAGLYFVGNAEKVIHFVMPVGLASALGTVAVNILNAGANTDTILRGLTPITAAQPDIFTSTNDALGNAVAFNVTDPLNRLLPPFNVTTTVGSNSVPTVVELSLTGIRLAAKTEVTVTIGTTALTNDLIVLTKSNPEMPGWDIINFTLPASLAGAGDVPIVVTVTKGTTTTSSRPADTAPKIKIN